MELNYCHIIQGGVYSARSCIDLTPAAFAERMTTQPCVTMRDHWAIYDSESHLEGFAGISTLVQKRLILPNRHVAALDIDSAHKLKQAVAYIRKQLKLHYAVIESSHEHYWVILDAVGTMGQIKEYQEAIPGVDPYWIKGCHQLGKCVFRAYPKVPHTPFFIRPNPHFTNKLAGEWYKAFYSYFHGKVFKAIRQRVINEFRISSLVLKCEKCKSDFIFFSHIEKRGRCAQCGHRFKLKDMEPDPVLIDASTVLDTKEGRKALAKAITPRKKEDHTPSIEFTGTFSFSGNNNDEKQTKKKTTRKKSRDQRRQRRSES